MKTLRMIGYFTFSLCFIQLALLNQANASYRIFCSPNWNGGQSIDTLHSDVVQEYVMPSIRVQAQDGKLVDNILDFIPTYSTQTNLEQKAGVYLVALERGGKTALYYAELDLIRRKSTSTFIADVPPMNGGILSTLSSLRLKQKVLAYDPVTSVLIYPDLKKQNYVLLNTITQESTVLDNTPLSLFANPRFISGYVVFDTLNKKYKITQKAIHLSLKSTISLPNAETNQLFLTPVDAQKWIWLENSSNDNSKSNWILKLKTNSLSSHNLGSVNTIKPNFIFNIFEDAIELIYNEEIYNSETDEYGNTKAKLTKGEIYFLKINKNNLTVENKTNLPYPEMVLNFLNKQSILSYNTLQEPMYNSESQQLIYSLGMLSGLVNIKLPSQTWNFLATKSASRCFNSSGIVETKK